MSSSPIQARNKLLISEQLYFSLWFKRWYTGVFLTPCGTFSVTMEVFTMALLYS